jgi:hypothetical protein
MRILFLQKTTDAQGDLKVVLEDALRVILELSKLKVEFSELGI